MTQVQRLENEVRQWVNNGLKITVVIPCFNVENEIASTVQTIPDYIHSIVLVNDFSVDRTGQLIDHLASDRVHAVHLHYNHGVGGATFAGYKKALKLDSHIIVKMDGDAQMDPEKIPLLVKPLVNGKADYVKGNRFRSLFHLSSMPRVRQFGNSVLSLLTKISSGYWNIMDPTNGFTAIRAEILEILPEKYIHSRYFFESSMLLALSLIRATVMDVSMAARYGLEKSNLRPRKVLFEFPWQLLIGLMRRIWYTKILYSLTIEAIIFFWGMILIFTGGIFGVIETIRYAIILNTPAPSGTVMLAALPVLLGFQMILNAIVLDIQSVPELPITDKITF